MALAWTDAELTQSLALPKSTLHAVVRAAPRIDSRLVAAIAFLDDVRGPIAETNRRIGVLAQDLGLPKPSYQQVRLLVHEHRRSRLAPGAGAILLDIAFRARPPEALLDYLSGTGMSK